MRHIKGVTNPTVITDDPSISVFGNCNLATPSATNFLVGVDGCKYTRKYQLCGIMLLFQRLMVMINIHGLLALQVVQLLVQLNLLQLSNVGTYYVHNTALAPCVSIDETVTVDLLERHQLIL